MRDRGQDTVLGALGIQAWEGETPGFHDLVRWKSVNRSGAGLGIKAPAYSRAGGIQEASEGGAKKSGETARLL